MKNTIKNSLFAILFFTSTIASAAIVDLTAIIDGGQANAGAGTGSTATGTGSFTFDTDTSIFSYDISFSGLSSDQTNAHIHGPAAPGVNAGVQIALPLGSSIADTVATPLTALQADDLLAGLWYVNIHSANFPGGEIRGQISAVPVPAAVWLFASGLIGLISLARKKH